MRRYGTKVESIELQFKERLRVEDRRYKYENQRAIGLTKIPSTPLKSVLDNALSEPWTGEEKPIQVTKRMLEDSIKPSRISMQQRLKDARENVLDYTLDKQHQHSSNKAVSKDSSRSGRKRLSAGMSGGGWIESMANMEIDNAIKMGKFNSIERGIQTEKLHENLLEVNKNPNIDLTEYLLNTIVKRQGGAPPWIMKQQAVRSRIAFFRAEMKTRLQERLVPKLLKVSKNDISYALDLSCDKTICKDEEWEKQYSAYHDETVASLNSQIRGYNLQSPPTARWGYLTVQSEISLCYSNIKEGLETQLRKYMGSTNVSKIDTRSLHSKLPPLEDPRKHYGLKQMVKDLFSKN